MASKEDLPKAPHPTAAAMESDAKPTLKGVSTQERSSLPDAETIAQEKKEVELRKSIQEKGENRASMTHVETVEKTPLPSKDGTHHPHML